MTGRRLSAPGDLEAKGRGRRFWRAVVAEHDLRADELELLAEVCRMLDLLDALRAAADPLLMSTVVGVRVHPALIEARQTRVELRRALAQLGLPDPVDEGGQEDVVPPRVADLRAQRARRAARARWDSGGL